MKSAAILLSLLATAPLVSFAGAPDRAGCDISPTFRNIAPSEPGVRSWRADGRPTLLFQSWYINADSTIWASVPEEGWPAGGQTFQGTRAVGGQKTYWVRPAGSQLEISGRRLDASAPPLQAHIPCCYTSGFQIASVLFPTEGCWEVTARAGANELRFVTAVRRETR
jgi:hypothetical protein